MFSIIAAGCVTDDPTVYGIGYHGGIPWHIPDDLAYFKKITTGSSIIMGYRTWKSLPGTLPNRAHIVISNKPEISDDIRYVNSLESALEIAVPPVFIIGGGAVYAEAMRHSDLCSAIYMTVIHSEYTCDTFIKIPNRSFESEFKIAYDTTRGPIQLEFRKYTL